MPRRDSVEDPPIAQVPLVQDKHLGNQISGFE